MKQTKISSGEFGWLHRDREFLAVALVFGITLTALENIKATDAPARPVKDLSKANGGHHWWLSVLKVRSENNGAN